nr:hypothetical protein [Tanacetum cinerariifolium]
MANPNPENLNVPNEGVPEEDPHHLLDYDKEEDPEMEIEEEEPEEEPVEEPEPLPGHGDQFDAYPNPQPGNMNGWVDDDDDIMPPKPMSEACMREIIRDQFATSMNEFMANMNSRAGGPGGASGSDGAGGFGGTGGNADGTCVRGTGPTVPELTGCTYATFIKCDPLPFNGTEGAV